MTAGHIDAHMRLSLIIGKPSTVLSGAKIDGGREPQTGVYFVLFQYRDLTDSWQRFIVQNIPICPQTS
jgi:hypothetical protein